MPTKTKQIDEDKVEYKVMECGSAEPAIISLELNDFAKDGWRVITAVQGGSRLILERDIVG